MVDMKDESLDIPDFNDVERAASVLEGNAIHTTAIRNAALNEITGANVWIKPENLQRTGSFKFRGAFNSISKVVEDASGASIVTCSSGNHAQGIATAAAIFKIPATIVMPSDAPKLKLERTRAAGATVITYDRETEDRDSIAHEVAKTNSAVFIHPYDNKNVIAGQGTLGLELAEDVSDSGQKLDRVLVCCGGGGLTSGVSVAIKGKFPYATIHPVEPQYFDDFARSLEIGERVGNEKLSGSICDAVLTPMPGVRAFAILNGMKASGLVVTEDQVKHAMRFAFRELKLVLEPGGAVALAALLASGKKYAGETLGVVLSGGNVDPTLFSEIISSGD